MKNIQKEVLYGIIGLLAGMLIGIALTHSFSGTNYHRGYKGSMKSGMMHQMPDGTMMNNSMKMNMDMSEMMVGMMAGLKGKTGDAFDQEFLSEMIVHHQGAVAMAQAVLETSKRPELLKLANDIIAAQTGEIKMMEAWQKSWFTK